jgi:hypothetical protein
MVTPQNALIKQTPAKRKTRQLAKHLRREQALTLGQQR